MNGTLDQNRLYLTSDADVTENAAVNQFIQSLKIRQTDFGHLHSVACQDGLYNIFKVITSILLKFLDKSINNRKTNFGVIFRL